jgi:ketosteroid isomerase-like protein
MTREENIETTRHAIQLFEQFRFGEFSKLFVEDGKWIQPFHSGLFLAETEGRIEIQKSFEGIAVNFDSIQLPIEEILPFEDPSKIAVKHTGHLVMKNGRGVYANDYLSIISFDEHGKILEWIEYYNPIIAARAFGMMDKIK